MIIRWIGQGGYALTDRQGIRYLVDPYLSGSVGKKAFGQTRLVAPPWPPQEASADFAVYS
jgi:L-ascorbate metabolism protein UlaG (beta-lactamase superfamily)